MLGNAQFSDRDASLCVSNLRVYVALKQFSIQEVLVRIVVSIHACHACDPGSIPGQEVFFALQGILGS
jgi:hypothetical protein